MINMNKKPSQEILANFCLICFAFLFCLMVLVLGEAACRLFSGIRFLGNSANLFIDNAYGPSAGNLRSSQAVSFGTKIYTDQYGFRIPPAGDNIGASYDYALLILGDSVGFGPGVSEEQTTAGLLRKNYPGLKIYNSSVIGYATPDYQNLIEQFIPLHPEVKKVYLFFCLNDVSRQSAVLIDRLVKSKNSGSGYLNTAVDSLKQVNWVKQLNEYLRAHSKLYLLFKNILTNPQYRYWKADYAHYLDSNQQVFLRRMQPVAVIAKLLKQKNIDFTVVILPYEYQLKHATAANRLPQDKIGAFLKQNNIRSIDIFDQFRKSGITAEKLFLPFDQAHFSEQGHAELFKILQSELDVNFRS